MERMAKNSNGLLALTTFVLFSTDSALVCTNSDRIWARISWIVIMLLALYYIPKTYSKINHKKILYPVLLSTGISISMLVHEIIGINYLQRIVLVWLACAFSEFYEKERVIYAYVKVMRFIAAYSLVCFVLSPILLQIPFPSLYCGNIVYKNLLFTNLSTYSLRNYGPFWEPGAYQIYLNLALFFVIRDPKRFNYRDLLLFGITVLSTVSTAGIIVLGLIVMYYLLSVSTNKQSSSKVVSWLIVASLAVGGIFYMYKNIEFTDSFFNKLTALSENYKDKNSENVSSYTRLYSVYANISAIREYPLSGMGIDGLTDYGLNKFDITANTNTILATAATYGLFVGIVYLLLLFKSIIDKKRRMLGNCIILVVFLIFLSTENMMVSLPMWTILFYGLPQRRQAVS